MKRIIFPVISITVMLGLVAISFAVFFKEARNGTDEIVAHDVKRLAEIFALIDSICRIKDFEHIHNYIDFLTVEAFRGSEIGSMNLVYPDNWEGPYLDDNPTVQEKYYEVLKTKQGYYIVPGQGVRLSNGKTIGADIVLNEFSDIQTMLLRTDKLLSKEGKPLAARIYTGGVSGSVAQPLTRV